MKVAINVAPGISQEDFMNSPVGNIVASDIRKADVMKKYGIDFCCGGGESLANACRTVGADPELVNEELQHINAAELLPSQNPYYWDLDFLCNYIEQTHHQYVRTSSKYLMEYGIKVHRTHGQNHPELEALTPIVAELLTELHQHMDKEERVLFPRIKQLAQTYRNPALGMVEAVQGMNINHPVQVMEHEHNEAGRLLYLIRELTDDYNPPADVCLTYKVYYAKLKEFEDDLTMHIHLENNLLFPKAVDLQEKYQSL